MKEKIIIVVLIIILVGLPFIKIRTNDTIKYISFVDDFSEYEYNDCYNESVYYYEKEDISITSMSSQKVFLFYIITLAYEEGNLCDYEYYLESSYIDDVIENAEIINNYKNIDLAKLIKGKSPIESNTLYLGNDYETMIDYKLNGKYETIYIFYKEDLLIFQVGSRDDGAKFIAYE